ncbi:hypothetical protein GCM10027579_28490 [Calidifontibacter terrae]
MQSASATSYYSSFGYFSAGSSTFQNQAIINEGSKEALTSTRWWSGTYTEYVGSEGRLFNAAGALVATSGMHYFGGGGLAEGVVCSNCGHGYYYSYGKSAGWNENGYAYSYTFRSPNGYL